MTTPDTPKKPTVDELRARVKPHGPWFDVPAGTREADCARCDADNIYWAKSKNGKRLLVDCAVEGGRLPTHIDTGRGVAHFATCPHAASFSTKGR